MEFKNREAIARGVDFVTSHESAAILTASGVRDAQKQQVLAALRQHPGVTGRELAAVSGIPHMVCWRRLPDLRADGLVKNGIIRKCRIAGNRRAITWWAR